MRYNDENLGGKCLEQSVDYLAGMILDLFLLLCV